MKTETKQMLKRSIGYIIGLILFFAPFGLYQRTIMAVVVDPGAADIHKMCLTMSIQKLLIGKIGSYTLGVALISLYLLVIVTVFFGPLFCGKLCPVGALPEYLSKIIPEKFQLKLKKNAYSTPIRYGFLLAFVVSPFIGTSLTCTFCSFSFFSDY